MLPERENAFLRAKLAEIKYELDSARERLAQIAAEPVVFGSILEVHHDDGAVLLAAQGQIVNVAMPDFEVTPGMQVAVQPKTLALLGPRTNPVTHGPVVTIHAVHGTHAEIKDATGAPRLVWVGSLALTSGMRVTLDPQGLVVTSIVPDPPSEDSAEVTTGVSWDDIGGLAEAKQQLIEAIEWPHKHKALFGAYGLRPAKGILLYGPPGCGKTMLGKAAATSLARLQGKDGAVGFFYVKGPEILHKWVGESESALRALFTKAKAFKAKHGYPAILFFDEADALFQRRGGGRLDGIEKTMVPMMLTEMDGLEESAALVILATNRPDTLDPAIVREGRIDRKIEITRPSLEDCIALAKLALRDTPATPSLAEAVASALGRSGLRDALTGALVAEVVSRARGLALREDIEREATAPSGIQETHVTQAVAQITGPDLQKSFIEPTKKEPFRIVSLR